MSTFIINIYKLFYPLIRFNWTNDATAVFLNNIAKDS